MIFSYKLSFLLYMKYLKSLEKIKDFFGRIIENRGFSLLFLVRLSFEKLFSLYTNIVLEEV
ncbi:hypothetical protein HMPREF9999_00729 [Alloprevotella sp. oral taxon 473 str. F0040]|nr:hypothetical protein HMPREF9999_00729 [Alloprevotella sp. oral taxon 473 str. F0040]